MVEFSDAMYWKNNGKTILYGSSRKKRDVSNVEFEVGML